MAPFWNAVAVALALSAVPTDLGTLELTVPLTQCANKVRGFTRASFITTFYGGAPVLPLFTDRVRTGRPR